MAIRYSGDAEVRLEFDPAFVTLNGRRVRVYRGRVSDAYLIWHGWIPEGTRTSNPRSSKAYDDAAKRLLAIADRWAKTNHGRAFESERAKGVLGIRGPIHIRRVYQAPCPTR